MATEYERPGNRVVERTHTTDTGSGMGIVLGLIIAFGIVAFLFFAFFDRSPPGPNSVSSKPTVTAPKTTVPAAKTEAPPAPSTK
jgi:hypothetical protein